ncbi:helix-turn-helix domain-containing protein [Harryflintia acetispora]|uniref:Stage 0 sporulation protein A homolog n=1 Tax=Harryflintia acetispora TaxID=1849041 RepID=A0A9X8Y7J7_9FIRM|nr:helix-turn-helix domain-containing protein [Harryflintia acetispora]TCL42403.1 two-component system response regulator YesN [Harryflintia acetispora]
MLKAIVVDDEYVVLEGLRSLADWSSYGVELAGTARNGSEGLALIERLRPEIVLTDIQMPVMDGLEMIRRAKEIVPESVFVIFSGFNEFRYAQSAISLGVLDYLEKPVTLESIDGAISRAVKLLHSRAPAGNSDMPKARAEQDALFQAVRALLDGTIQDFSQYVAFFEERGLPLPPLRSGGAAALRIAQRDGEGNHAAPRNTVQDGYAALCRSFQRRALREGEQAVFLQQEGDLLLVLLSPGAQELCLTRRLSALAAEGEYSFFAGVGEDCADPLHLPLCCLQARQALRYALFREENSVLPIGEVQSGPLPAGGGREEEILYRLRAGEREETLAAVDGLLDFWWKSNLSPQLFCHECLELCYLGLRAAQETGENYLETLGEGYLPHEELFRLRGYRQICGWVRGFFGRLCDWLQEVKSRGMHKGVLEAKQYILKNYDKSLTLQELAQAVYMNPTYLSMLFKEQVGTTYIKFLTSVRLEHARELLERGMKVSAVSSQVGFHDARHFSEVFKKTFGITPDQYKHGH